MRAVRNSEWDIESIKAVSHITKNRCITGLRRQKLTKETATATQTEHHRLTACRTQSCDLACVGGQKIGRCSSQVDYETVRAPAVMWVVSVVRDRRLNKTQPAVTFMQIFFKI